MARKSASTRPPCLPAIASSAFASCPLPAEIPPLERLLCQANGGAPLKLRFEVLIAVLVVAVIIWRAVLRKGHSISRILYFRASSGSDGSHSRYNLVQRCSTPSVTQPHRDYDLSSTGRPGPSDALHGRGLRSSASSLNRTTPRTARCERERKGPFSRTAHRVNDAARMQSYRRNPKVRLKCTGSSWPSLGFSVTANLSPVIGPGQRYQRGSHIVRFALLIQIRHVNSSINPSGSSSLERLLHRFR